MNGAVMPVFGYFLAKVLGVLAKFGVFDDPNENPDYTKDDLIDESDLYLLAFLGLAFGNLILSYFQYYIFNYIGEVFTYNLRVRYFRKFVFMDMEYYD